MPEHTFFCGLDPPRRRPKHSHVLRARGPERNILLDPLVLTTRLATTIEPKLLDLIDIGTYVFVADRIIRRGGRVADAMGRDWRRQLHFKIAVREPQRWSDPELGLLLEDVLGFMSEDDFSFEFEPAQLEPSQSDYFQFGADSSATEPPAPVILFSGGLDSLAGTLEELNSGRRQVVLVSHQSSSIVTRYQNALVRELTQRYRYRVLHLPLRMRLEGLKSNESSQRTRTFLFSCIAGAIASVMGAPGIRYYENGIMSLNLPLSDQVVGTAATRSTHPRTLSEMSLFLGAALGAECRIDNPYIYRTKSEVMQTFSAVSATDLIDMAFTCTEVRRRQEGKSHCGGCLQCLHRRFGAFSAGLDGFDGSDKYGLDLFESPREGDDQTMLFDLVRRARQFADMSDAGQFFKAFPLELARLRGSVAGVSEEELVGEMFQLHRRFGGEVLRVIQQGLQKYKELLSKGQMAPGSLLTFVIGDQKGQGAAGASAIIASRAGSAALAGPIELTIDSARGEFSINRGVPTRGKRSVQFLSLLAEQHRKDLQADRPIEEFEYLSTQLIKSNLGISDEALRRMVERLRNRIAAGLAARDLPSDDRAIVVQSRSWQGYRLNPTIRLVAPSK
jgi:7-cyano-7-deazaguanine synthase in queuosine biosynthesis